MWNVERRQLLEEEPVKGEVEDTEAAEKTDICDDDDKDDGARVFTVLPLLLEEV